MTERALVDYPGTLTCKETLVRTDFTVLQCIVDGWTDREISALHINPERAKTQIVRKMRSDGSLFEFLGRVDELPFVSQNFLTPTEGMVAFLSKAGFRNVEIHKKLGLGKANVTKYRKKIDIKIDDRKHCHVPLLTEDIAIDDGMGVGLTKGIFAALQQGRINTERISAEPAAMLSYNESRALFLTCAGMSPRNIALMLEDKSEATVETFIRRARQKLGVSKKYQMIAKGQAEMIRVQKTI